MFTAYVPPLPLELLTNPTQAAKKSSTECSALTSSASKPTATPDTSPLPAFAYAGMKLPVRVLWLRVLVRPGARALFRVARLELGKPAERASRVVGRARRAEQASRNMWVLMYRGMWLLLRIARSEWMRRGLQGIREFFLLGVHAHTLSLNSNARTYKPAFAQAFNLNSKHSARSTQTRRSS